MTRIVAWCLLALLGVFALKWIDRSPQHQKLGHAVACDPNYFPFKDQQAEIIEYGLQDARGIAWGNNTVYIAEGSRPLVTYLAGRQYLSDDQRASMCPEQSCAGAGRHGVAVSGNKLFTAEYGRGEVSVRNIPVDGVPEQPIYSGVGPSNGISAVGKMLFLTDDRPWLHDKKSHATGGLYVCEREHCVPELIDGSLQQPSGVAAVTEDGPVYVAESDAQQVRWRVYGRPNGKWVQTGALASVSIQGASMAQFLGVAATDKLVFAAGPSGLYTFARDGTLLGRMIFEDPVTGITIDRDVLYLATGHDLCWLCIGEAHKTRQCRQMQAHVRPS